MKRSHMIAAIYLLVILCSLLYFGVMQNFGQGGLTFRLEGRDRLVTLFDVLIVAATAAALSLFTISLLAYRRSKDERILVVSMAFFFFAVKEFLFVLDNFFPGEFIYIGNAERVLELLILISFVMLMYGTYKRGNKIKAVKHGNSK